MNEDTSYYHYYSYAVQEIQVIQRQSGKKDKIALVGVVQLVGALSCALKGCRFQSQSRPMLGPW